LMGNKEKNVQKCDKTCMWGKNIKKTVYVLQCFNLGPLVAFPKRAGKGL